MAKQSDVALKLKRLRERAGMTVRELAEALGMPASTYAAYEDKFKKLFLPVGLVKKIAPIFAKAGIDETEVLALAGLSDAYYYVSKRAEGGRDMAQIEEVDASVSAGPGTTVGDLTVIRQWQVAANMVNFGTDSAISKIKIIRVKGDSMTPTFNPTDRIMVDTGDIVPSPEGIFVVWDGVGFVLKRVQIVAHSDPVKVRLMSDNKSYQPYERVLSEAYLQGRVIGKWLWT